MYKYIETVMAMILTLGLLLFVAVLIVKGLEIAIDVNKLNESKIEKCICESDTD